MENKKMGEFPRYIEAGRGPAVILNHGTLMDATMFDPQLEYLSKRGYRVIAQNSRVLLGNMNEHTLIDLADDTAKLAEELGLTRYVVGGMSVGAFSSLEFALKFPDRLAGLILIDGKAVDYPVEEQVAFGAEFEKMKVDGPVTRGFAEWAGPYCFCPEAGDVAAHSVERWATKIPARAVWAQSTAWVRKLDRTPELRNIKVPVLMIHGANDLPVPLSRALPMVAELPDVTLVKVPNAGHTSNLEKPEIVNHAIASFLERIYPR
jgi:pimeloyl-ACP methyl ester carboxylesterase